MKVPGCLVAVVIATVVAGCGGSHKNVAHHAATRLGQRNAAVAPALAIVLPASTAGPTTCTVYGPGDGAQLVFDSQSLNVSGECQAWSSREPGAGYLWAYQPTDAAIDATAFTACDLRDPSGRITVAVIDDTGFAPLSASERRKTATACTSLSLAGWVRVIRSSRARQIS